MFVVVFRVKIIGCLLVYGFCESHIGWRVERSISYKGVETSP